jgi:dihydropteroate synthase
MTERGEGSRRPPGVPGTGALGTGAAGTGGSAVGEGAAASRDPGPLRLGSREFGPARGLVMAIVNRTPDSFYRPGVTWDERAALARVEEVVAEGADILDIGGVPAKPGQQVTAVEEIRRVVPFIGAVRSAYPDLVISVDTWRHDVGRAACEAGADLLNDTWGGWDPLVAEVAADLGVGLVCSHAGGLPPRTRPFRIGYDDVVSDVLATVLGLATRALRAGVDPARIIIDPAHDFGKNSWHSLEVTRRLSELTATGWPVLLSASHKDFVGETLGTGIDERLAGTLATTAVAAWLGARVFRAHNIVETRQALDMVAAIKGDLRPARIVRGLA